MGPGGGGAQPRRPHRTIKSWSTLGARANGPKGRLELRMADYKESGPAPDGAGPAETSFFGVGEFLLALFKLLRDLVLTFL